MPTLRIRIKFSFARITGILILMVGITALISSTVTNSTTSAMIGLGLMFWGIILLYVQTEEYVKARALDTIILSAPPALEQTLKGLGYKGKASYLPPRYFNESEIVKVFVPKRRAATLLTPEQAQKLVQKPRRQTAPGILLTPLAQSLQSFSKQY